MSIESYVEKRNKEQAEALYAKERAKTLSEQYLDYFKTWNVCICEAVKNLNICIKNYEQRGNEYLSQVPFIKSHINVLRAYQRMLNPFMANLAENIVNEKAGNKVDNILKMRSINDLDMMFNGLDGELKFVDAILSGAFDIVTNYDSKYADGFRNLFTPKGLNRQR